MEKKIEILGIEIVCPITQENYSNSFEDPISLGPNTTNTEINSSDEFEKERLPHKKHKNKNFNVNKNHKSNKYIETGTSLKFTEQEWNTEIYDITNNKLCTDSFMDCIRKKFQIFYPCIVYCKNNKISSKKLQIYAYKCRQPNCPRYYKMYHYLNVNSGDETILYVDFKGGEIVHDDLLTNQLRGKSRVLLKEKLKTSYATDVQNEQILNIDLKLKN